MFKKQQASSLTRVVLNTQKFIAIYLVLSILLIIFFDYILPQLSIDRALINNIASIEFWIYLFISMTILSLLLKYYTIENSETELQQNNIQLTDRNRDLLATEEKLRQQLAESLQQQTIINEQNEYLLVLLTAIPDLIFHFDKNGLFVDYKGITNTKLLPHSINPLIGKSVYDLFPPLLAGDTLQSIAKVLDTNEPQVMEYHLPMDSEDRYWEARLIKLNNTQVMALIRDTTQRSQLLKELHYVSLHDHLTGLYNRSYFEQQMQQLHGTEHVPVTLFVCDLDGLKTINDTLGHQFGDQLLKAAATTLSSAFNTHDIIARIGGDEFAIFLPNTPHLEALAAYQRIRSAESEYNAQKNPIVLSISIGFAVSNQHSVNMNDLFLEADTKMYKEKMDRKSQY